MRAVSPLYLMHSSYAGEVLWGRIVELPLMLKNTGGGAIPPPSDSCSYAQYVSLDWGHQVLWRYVVSICQKRERDKQQTRLKTRSLIKGPCRSKLQNIFLKKWIIRFCKVIFTLGSDKLTEQFISMCACIEGNPHQEVISCHQRFQACATENKTSQA